LPLLKFQPPYKTQTQEEQVGEQTLESWRNGTRRSDT